MTSVAMATLSDVLAANVSFSSFVRFFFTSNNQHRAIQKKRRNHPLILWYSINQCQFFCCPSVSSENLGSNRRWSVKIRVFWSFIQLWNNHQRLLKNNWADSVTLWQPLVILEQFMVDNYRCNLTTNFGVESAGAFNVHFPSFITRWIISGYHWKISD